MDVVTGFFCVVLLFGVAALAVIFREERAAERQAGKPPEAPAVPAPTAEARTEPPAERKWWFSPAWCTGLAYIPLLWMTQDGLRFLGGLIACTLILLLMLAVSRGGWWVYRRWTRRKIDREKSPVRERRFFEEFTISQNKQWLIKRAAAVGAVWAVLAFVERPDSYISPVATDGTQGWLVHHYRWRPNTAVPAKLRYDNEAQARVWCRCDKAGRWYPVFREDDE